MSIGDKRIYLASRSPRRRELLKQMGVPFELFLLREDMRRGADVDETPLPDESPGVYVLRMAGAKANMAVRQIAYRGLPQKPVLAADTTVALGGRSFGKPADRREAAAILSELSGKRHEVLTAVALAYGSNVETALSASEVQFRELSPQEIGEYVATGECDDKAGAYAIQGRAARFVAEIRGSHSGIVGLPLYETAQLLDRFGAQRERRNPY